MGFSLNDKTNMYCDNQSVVHNASKIESTLKKKHLSACYHNHKVRESCATGAIHIVYKLKTTNIADICTKIMLWFKKREKLRCILYNSYCAIRFFREHALSNCARPNTNIQ